MRYDAQGFKVGKGFFGDWTLYRRGQIVAVIKREGSNWRWRMWRAPWERVDGTYYNGPVSGVLPTMKACVAHLKLNVYNGLG